MEGGAAICLALSLGQPDRKLLLLAVDEPARKAVTGRS
jgi:hypothetical protein